MSDLNQSEYQVMTNMRNHNVEQVKKKSIKHENVEVGINRNDSKAMSKFCTKEI